MREKMWWIIWVQIEQVVIIDFKLYQGDTSFYYSILAFRYSREFTTVHEISNCSAVINFESPFLLKQEYTYCLVRCENCTYRKHKRDRPIDHERQVRYFYTTLKKWALCHLPIVHIISQGPYISRKTFYEDTQAIAHEASIKGWTRLLNDQWALIISNAVREYFLMAIFNTLIDEKKNKILVGRVLDRNLEGSLFCLSRSPDIVQ